MILRLFKDIFTYVCVDSASGDEQLRCGTSERGTLE